MATVILPSSTTTVPPIINKAPLIVPAPPQPQYTELESPIEAIIDVLAQIVEVNEGVIVPDSIMGAFGDFATKWEYDWATVREYVKRLEEWIVCGPESFVAAVCIMRRLENLGVLPPITQRTVHRCFLTSLVIAVKFMEDETLSNTDFAKVGCVTVTELNNMEKMACLALNFGCAVREEEYESCLCGFFHYLHMPSKRLAKRLARRRAEDGPLTIQLLFECVHIDDKKRPSLRIKGENLFNTVRKTTHRLSIKRFSAPIANTAALAVSPRASKADKVTPVFIIRQNSL